MPVNGLLKHLMNKPVLLTSGGWWQVLGIGKSSKRSRFPWNPASGSVSCRSSGAIPCPGGAETGLPGGGISGNPVRCGQQRERSSAMGGQEERGGQGSGRSRKPRPLGDCGSRRGRDGVPGQCCRQRQEHEQQQRPGGQRQRERRGLELEPRRLPADLPGAAEPSGTGAPQGRARPPRLGGAGGRGAAGHPRLGGDRAAVRGSRFPAAVGGGADGNPPAAEAQR